MVSSPGVVEPGDSGLVGSVVGGSKPSNPAQVRGSLGVDSSNVSSVVGLVSLSVDVVESQVSSSPFLVGLSVSSLLVSVVGVPGGEPFGVGGL